MFIFKFYFMFWIFVDDGIEMDEKFKDINRIELFLNGMLFYIDLKNLEVLVFGSCLLCKKFFFEGNFVGKRGFVEFSFEKVFCKFC